MCLICGLFQVPAYARPGPAGHHVVLSVDQEPEPDSDHSVLDVPRDSLSLNKDHA